jgi:CRP-like cAMP-binding protein
VSIALTSVRLALLDETFAERVMALPQITDALIRRATRRSMELNAQRAATSHPRADVRVALLLWHLAQRWGKVQRDGILLCLPLTHRLISRLVGIERPSVSHALSRLSHNGLVERCEDGLMLRGSAEHHIACLIDRNDQAFEAQA